MEIIKTQTGIVLRDGLFSVSFVRKERDDNTIEVSTLPVPSFDFKTLEGKNISLEMDFYGDLKIKVGEDRPVYVTVFFKDILSEYELHTTRVLVDLVGSTIRKILINRPPDQDPDELCLWTDTNKYTFYHGQDCCGHVSMTDIPNNLEDLVGSVLTTAEERVCENRGEDETYTFYEFATTKGSCTIRWLGSSNGYYSEKVDIAVTPREEIPDEWSDIPSGTLLEEPKT